MVGQSRGGGVGVGWGASPPRRERREGCGGPSRAKGKSHGKIEKKKRRKGRRAVEQTSKRTELECREGAGVKAKPRSEGNGGTERSVDLVVSRSIFEFQRVASSGGNFMAHNGDSPPISACRPANHVAPHPPDMQFPPSRLARARRFSSYVLIF